MTSRRMWLSVLTVLAALLLAMGAAACGGDDDEGGAATTAETQAEAVTAGLVSDVGRFNDKSFNQSALEGLNRAKDELGADTRAIESRAAGDYVPNLSSLARQGYDVTIGVGFLLADGVNTVARQFPDANFAIIDYSVMARAVHGREEERRDPGQRPRPDVRDEREQLSDRLHRRDDGQGAGGEQVICGVGGLDIPTVEHLHRRLPGRREEVQPGDRGPDRVLAGLRCAGQVQGARAEPDRPGLAGRVPGRRWLWPRRPRRGQGRGGVGDRRRHRPVLPRRAHPHERGQAGRHGGVRHHQGGPRTARSRAATTRCSTSKNEGVGVGKISSERAPGILNKMNAARSSRSSRARSSRTSSDL